MCISGLNIHDKMFDVKELTRQNPNLNTLTNTGQKTGDLLYLGILPTMSYFLRIVKIFDKKFL